MLKNKENIIIEFGLLESSLSRLWQTMQEHDTGIITAFRKEHSVKVNLERNQMLLADLRRLFNVTSVKGSYIQDFGSPQATEVGENSYFVSDVKDFGTLEKELFRLGQKYDQDSIMFIPRGGKKGFLLGTKEGVWPGLGTKHHYDNPVFGKGGEFMTRVNRRPFVFKNEAVEHFPKDGPKGFFGEWIRNAATRYPPKD